MQTKVDSAVGVLETLSQLEASVRYALDGARGYLQQTFNIVDREDTSDVGGWNQFLNENDKPSSGTGTSHGVLSLLACGEPPDSEIITMATHFLVMCQCKDGGWSKLSLHNKCSLTRITGLSLRALLDSGARQPLAAIQDGIEWLLKAENEDGGWGNTARDAESDVTSTSFALQAMTRIVGLTQQGRDSIQQGQAWLIKARNTDHSWGYTSGKPGTVAHTSEAIDGLLACGRNPASLRATIEWLNQHIGDQPQFNERYLIPNGPCRGTSVIWTQVSMERGLVALLSLGSSLIAQPVVHAVNDVLSRQVNGNYWSADAFHATEPIWAVKEAVVALRHFQDRIERERASVVLSEELVGLRRELSAVQQQINHLLDREVRRSWKGLLRAFWNTVRKPSVTVGIATTLLVICYIALRRHLQLPEYADILAAVAGFGGLALTLYQVVLHARGGGNSE